MAGIWNDFINAASAGASAGAQLANAISRRDELAQNERLTMAKLNQSAQSQAAEEDIAQQKLAQSAQQSAAQLAADQQTAAAKLQAATQQQDALNQYRQQREGDIQQYRGTRLEQLQQALDERQKQQQINESNAAANADLRQKVIDISQGNLDERNRHNLALEALKTGKGDSLAALLDQPTTTASPTFGERVKDFFNTAGSIFGGGGGGSTPTATGTTPAEPGTPASPWPEGTKLRSKTNPDEVYEVRNGVPVLIEGANATPPKDEESNATPPTDSGWED
jgi:hypothetical protein